MSHLALVTTCPKPRSEPRLPSSHVVGTAWETSALRSGWLRAGKVHAILQGEDSQKRCSAFVQELGNEKTLTLVKQRKEKPQDSPHGAPTPHTVTRAELLPPASPSPQQRSTGVARTKGLS